MEDQDMINYLESFVSEERLKRFDDVLHWRTKFLTVIMEDVYHLHNASAVIRTADIFGIQEVHIIEQEVVNDIDRKISRGAQKWTDTYRYPSTEECIQNLKAQGYIIVATSPRKGALALDKLPLKNKLAIMLGAEKDGLTPRALELADLCVHIPMVGFTESLNVSVAAAIILQHLTAKLHDSELNWHLTDEEKAIKKLEWVKKSIKNINQIIARYTRDK